MKERSTVYVRRRPDDDDDGSIPSIPTAIIEIPEEEEHHWYMVDGGQLVMPVILHSRNGQDVDPHLVMLKQYGGDRLARQILERRIEVGDDLGGQRLMLSENAAGAFVFEDA